MSAQRMKLLSERTSSTTAFWQSAIPRSRKKQVEEIIQIILDAVCSTSPTLRINGERMPQSVVKSRLLKLNTMHIDYVLDAMKECPSDIRNIRAYLLTTLYNASLTMDNYYTAKFNHDFHGDS